MRLSTYLVLIPVVIVASFVAVANRQAVVFSFDPFSDTAPALALEAPLFVFLFLALLLGVVLGGLTVALVRGARRLRPARRETAGREKGTALLPFDPAETRNHRK